jgi:hypothetical protein
MSETNPDDTDRRDRRVEPFRYVCRFVTPREWRWQNREPVIQQQKRLWADRESHVVWQGYRKTCGAVSARCPRRRFSGKSRRTVLDYAAL